MLVSIHFMLVGNFSRTIIYITEICAELMLARWTPNFDYNPAGNLGGVAGSNDPWRCGLASPSMGSWINSVGVLPHFCGRGPLSRSSGGGSSCQAVDYLMRGVFCCARRHRKKSSFFSTFSPWTLYSYNHPVNHMNICISLNLAINSPIETGCHNDNLNMKRGTENCCKNKHWSLWGNQCFTNFLVSRAQPWFRKIYVPEKRHVTKSGKLACTFITIFSITWAEH